jgi:Na+/melibiose symporter-like transporter
LTGQAPSRATGSLDPARTYRHLLAQWTMSNLAHFGVMAVVSLYLLTVLRLPPVVAATSLFGIILASRLSRLLAMPAMDWLGGRGGLRLGLALGLAGNLGLWLAPWPPAVVLLLVAVGAAYSTTALAIKTIVARLPVDSRLMRYAAINLCLNLGAAAGPLLTNALFLHWRPRGAFLAGAAAYGLALLLSTRLRRLPPIESAGSGLRGQLRAALASLGLWRALLLNTLGFFLYSQLYATLPLYVGTVLRQPDFLGVLLAINGAFAVAVQMPVMRLAARLAGPTALVLLAFAGYAAGFATVWLTASWIACTAAVLVWTLSETLLFPAVDAMFADPKRSGDTLVAFTAAGVSAAVGEALGSLTGVALAGLLAASGALPTVYAVFAGGALASLGLAAWATRRPGPGAAR